MKIKHLIKVDSQNDKKQKYLVQIFEDGSATCECQSWQFRNKGNLFYQCKHIKRCLEYLSKKNKQGNNLA